MIESIFEAVGVLGAAKYLDGGKSMEVLELACSKETGIQFDGERGGKTKGMRSIM